MIKKFDRVLLNNDYFINNKKIIIKKDTIGTVRDIVDSNAITQIGFENNNPELRSIPVNLLTNVTAYNLDSLQTLQECINIVNQLYHPNNSYIDKEGTIYTIQGIRLADNELYDEFIVSIQKEKYIESKTVSRKFLDENTSLLPYNNYEDLNKETIQKKEYLNLKEPICKTSENEMKILINEYEFLSDGENIWFPKIKIKSFKEFDQAYLKLKKLINER